MLNNPETVDLHEEDFYKNGKAYMTSDGLAGFFITEEKDLVSVFNNSGRVGFLEEIKPIVKEKALTLDCYEYLKGPYKKILGYKPVAEVEFNEEVLRSKNGDEFTDNFIKKYGKVPVTLMANVEKQPEIKYFKEWDEAAKYREEVIEDDKKRKQEKKEMEDFLKKYNAPEIRAAEEEYRNNTYMYK